MCRFETNTVSFLLNIGGEIDLEGWRRKLDIFNRGYKRFSDFSGEIEFDDKWVDVVYLRHHYTIYRNGDIYFSFNPYEDFYLGKRKLEETLGRDFDDLIRENLSDHIQSLTRFLREKGLDIPSKFIVKKVTQSDWLVPNDRDKWVCYIDLERFEMTYENEMDIEYKGTYLIVKFQSIHPNLKITVELDNAIGMGGFVKAIVESSDQTPIDVLSDEGFFIIKDYLVHIGSSLYMVEEAIKKIEAYELVRRKSLFELVRRKSLFEKSYNDDDEWWLP